jgi:ribosomal protein L4
MIHSTRSILAENARLTRLVGERGTQLDDLREQTKALVETLLDGSGHETVRPADSSGSFRLEQSS